MIQSRWMLLLLAAILQYMLLIIVIWIYSLESTPFHEQPKLVAKFKQLQPYPEDNQTSASGFRLKSVMKEEKSAQDSISGSIDYTVVQKKYPGLIFLPNYKLQSFIIPDPHNGLERKLQDISEAEAEERFYSLITTRHVMCANMQRMGKAGDGGWDICVSEPYKPKTDCLVYSFGINNDYSFDDAMAMEYGCHVKAFDPSMHFDDHQRTERVWFYQLGLGATDTVIKNGWKLKTLASILSQAHHLNKILDVLKIDIEYNDRSAFRTMINEGALDRVRQFVFEIHTNEVNGKPSSVQDFYDMAEILFEIEKIGFRRFHYHYNKVGKYRSVRTGIQRTCCYELYYININFLNDNENKKSDKA